jgi:hypothetical protein
LINCRERDSASPTGPWPRATVPQDRKRFDVPAAHLHCRSGRGAEHALAASGVDEERRRRAGLARRSVEKAAAADTPADATPEALAQGQRHERLFAEPLDRRATTAA